MTDIAEGKCRVCVRQNATSVAYACNDCVNRFIRLVGELVVYGTLILPNMVQPGGGMTGRGSPGFGPRSPARDDVISALDPRSLPGDVDEHGDAVMRRPDDGATWVASIPGRLAGLANAIAEDRDEARPGGTLDADAGYITRNAWWLAGQSWIGEAFNDMAEVHAMARQLSGDAPQRSLGACLNVTCGRDVFWGGVGKPAQCTGCKRTYDGLDLVRLEAAQETAA
ncbi:hypothetical protein VSH64_24945 [Amycolatopsis rhabdoformis]|uniref:Uncharacterized protein n=1 Tax=Amycolatopsis rhabdoformis TaxID=1448059 RepID=A0ABZ1HX77_9PSEU|nr:hypothetical protein [Amycolatopsis rhabdoformis]WSE26126.1 hypothetical protein VSH64_24945 [Amycolatopsis rhabdoformis]